MRERDVESAAMEIGALVSKNNQGVIVVDGWLHVHIVDGRASLRMQSGRVLSEYDTPLGLKLGLQLQLVPLQFVDYQVDKTSRVA